jgi:hypothetical protein
MMALYKLVGLHPCDCCNATHEVATLSDIHAVLSDLGLVAVPLEPTEAMINKGAEAIHDLSSQDYEGDAMAAYLAMIAAQEKSNDSV